MAYNPIHDYRAKDALPSGSEQKVIRGADLSDEFEAISNAFRQTVEMAGCKYNGTDVKYSYNVSSVENRGGGIWRVNFTTPVQRSDDNAARQPVVNPGDFAGIVTPYAANGRMAIASITDQQEAFVDIAIRELDGNSWVIPASISFAFLLIEKCRVRGYVL